MSVLSIKDILDKSPNIEWVPIKVNLIKIKDNYIHVKSKKNLHKLFIASQIDKDKLIPGKDIILNKYIYQILNKTGKILVTEIK